MLLYKNYYVYAGKQAVFCIVPILQNIHSPIITAETIEPFVDTIADLGLAVFNVASTHNSIQRGVNCRVKYFVFKFNG